MVWVEKMKRGTYKFEIVFIDDSTVIFETVPNNFVRVRLSDETWEYFERFDRFYNFIIPYIMEVCRMGLNYILLNHK